jgi:hypothetical protein
MHNQMLCSVAIAARNQATLGELCRCDEILHFRSAGYHASDIIGKEITSSLKPTSSISMKDLIEKGLVEGPHQ